MDEPKLEIREPLVGAENREHNGLADEKQNVIKIEKKHGILSNLGVLMRFYFSWWTIVLTLLMFAGIGVDIFLETRVSTEIGSIICTATGTCPDGRTDVLSHLVCCADL